jgi:hypothetical protein
LGPATGNSAFLPTQALSAMQQNFEHWVRKYGEEQAHYLVEVMKTWTEHYTHGVLIDYDFTQPLALADQVRQVCAERGWEYERVEGDLRLLQRWLDGDWAPEDFLVVPPGRQIVPSYKDSVICLDNGDSA